MRSFWLVLVLLLTPQLRAAPKVAFPYQAVVEAQDAYVRSGPGSKYYPTSKLKRGQTVVVHRHDPGGWYMIAPPAGSFSWIPAKYVDKTGANRGTVSTNNVAVRVGSFESDIRELFQQRLSQGDEVRIIDEKMLAPESGTDTAELWYRIEPPRGEWRWIMGQALSPAPVAGRKAPEGDPFLDSGNESGEKMIPPITTDDEGEFQKPRRDDAGELNADEYDTSGDRDMTGGHFEHGPVRHEIHSPAESSGPKRKTGLDADLEELDRLDVRLRSILEKEPRDWDFAQLEEDYRALQSETQSESVRRMINARLERIADYARQRAGQEDFDRQLQETLRRDAELEALQRQYEARLTGVRRTRYDGAGIVGRAALNRPGAPRHALLTPDGRVLAYLVAAPGVNLDTWIGRPAGIIGRRVPNSDLKADLITVTGLSPVRLQP